jgi:hypothetical protein
METPPRPKYLTGSQPPAGPRYPQHAKIVALQLPMKTIADFVAWLANNYPTVAAGSLRMPDALYEYYNIDVQALAEERDALTGNNPEPEG